MSENVISIASGKTLREEEETRKADDQARADADKAAQLEALDNIKKLIEQGKLNSFVVIGRSPVGVFLTELAIANNDPTEVVLSYIGAIECLKLELTDIGQTLPQMVNDGSIVTAVEVVEG